MLWCIRVLLAAVLATGAHAQTTALVWPKPDLFWYRKTVPGGNLWIKVDAQYGAKEPLFDHQRLAIELTIRTGTEYNQFNLPLADPSAQFVVKYDGSNAYIQSGAMAIEFILGTQWWRCDLQIKWNWNLVPPTDYECLARRPVNPDQPPAVAPAKRRSPDGKWEAQVVNHNVVVRAVGETGMTLLSRDGTADFAYQFGSITWSPDSKSVSAYRVNEAIWNSDGVSGNVKRHVARGEWKLPVR